MARYEVSDELWVRIEPLLPVRARRARWPGRLPLDDRGCLNGILFVLLTGISWVDLPQQLGYGSGMTCWRRLRDWTQAGVWGQLHALLLAELHAADQIDWSRAAADGSHVRAKRGPRRSVQARSTGQGQAASTISSSTVTASRSRSR
jgi:transposase